MRIVVHQLKWPVGLPTGLDHDLDLFHGAGEVDEMPLE